MPKPVRLLEVMTPLAFPWEPSVKMLRTSISRLVGGCTRIPNSGPFVSFGSITAGSKERLPGVVPPTTNSGPRMSTR